MDSLNLYTAITPGLLKKKLIDGFLLALIGIVFIVFGAIFLDADDLSTWGFLVFVPAILLIGCGLVPYKRLKRLSEKPETLTISQEGNLIYKNRVLIPLEDIENVFYIDTSKIYGIGIRTKTKRSFFFPYFSQRSYDELVGWVGKDI